MAWTIDDRDVAYAPNPQSRLFKSSLDALIAGVEAQTAVVSGCAVSQRAAGANMSVDFASGIVRSGGTYLTVTSGNVAVTAAHATLNRIDLAVVDSAGAKQVRAGSAAANPKEPTPTAGDVVCAQIYIPALTTAITDSAPKLITDRRVVLPGFYSPWIDFVPAYTQSTTIPKTTADTRYTQIGKTVRFSVNLTATGSGTAANDLSISIPVTARNSSGTIGTGEFVDVSSGLVYFVHVILIATTAVKFKFVGSTTNAFLGSSGFTDAVASGDILLVESAYEAA